jgi:hypothetical protein
MHKLIQDWLDALDQLDDARVAADAAETDAYAAPLPKHLRPAEARDIVEGAILWYPEWMGSEESRGWAMVGEVMYPSDPWKAYCAHDGCRYGLDGAFVEIEPTEAAQ